MFKKLVKGENFFWYFILLLETRLNKSTVNNFKCSIISSISVDPWRPQKFVDTKWFFNILLFQFIYKIGLINLEVLGTASGT